jgi:Fic family protein
MLTDFLKKLDSQKQKLDAFRPLSPKQLTNLKKIFDVDFTYNSNAIEGNTLTYSETKFIIKERITIGGKKASEYFEVVNHKEAIDYIETLVQHKHYELTRDQIFKIHKIILQNIDPSNAGVYRTVPVYVKKSNQKTYHFCDPANIALEMDNFFQWFFNERSLHPVVLAAEAHYRFVAIHPFIDGNGRTARLLMNLILMQYGYPPAIIKVESRKAYLDSIELRQDTGNAELFNMLIAEETKNSLDIYIETLQKNIQYE